MYDFDLFVIGAGSGGLAASKNAAKLGKKVAIAEGDLVGGTCVIRGCVPKKIMSYAAHYADAFDEAEGYGFSTQKTAFDFKSFTQKRNAEISKLNARHILLLKEANVTLIEGYAHFLDAHTLSVNGKTYTAETIIISTGSAPVKLNTPGIEYTSVSDDIFSWNTLPESLVIVGGGYIAVEFASIFNALGVDVTIIIRKDVVLRGFDEDIRMHIQKEMTQKGIKFLTEEDIDSFEKQENGSIKTLLKSGKSTLSSRVLTAVGRTPLSHNLGLEKTCIQRSKNGAIQVNTHLQTAEKNIYAIGDVIDRIALTPVAIKHGRLVTNNLYTGQNLTVDDHAPSAVFTSPPIGSVGATENEAIALESKENIEIYSSHFKPMVHQLSGKEERSFMKMIVNKTTRNVLGLHMVGKDAPEIIQGFAVALRAGLTKEDFDATVAIHPSSAEEFVLMR